MLNSLVMLAILIIMVIVSIIVTTGIELHDNRVRAEKSDMKWGRTSQLWKKLRDVGYISEEQFVNDYNEWIMGVDIRTIRMYGIVNERGLWKIKSKIKGFY